MQSYLRTSRSGRKRRIPLVGALFVFFLIAAGVLGYGTYRLGWFSAPQEPVLTEEKDPLPGNTVPVPMSAREIPAHSAVTRDDILNSNGTVAYVHLPKENLNPNILLDFTKINGRVLKRKKAPGFVFTEQDFWPKGTLASFTAAIPPGRRSFRVSQKLISGLRDLKAGDKIDILVTVPLKENSKSKAWTVPQKISAMQPTEKAETRILTQGTVIAHIPVEEDSEKKESSKKPDVILAVTPAEVSKLSEAIVLEQTLTAVAHTGQSHDEEKITYPKYEEGKKNNGPVVMEELVGQTRTFLLFPEGSDIPITIE
ncbi:MAG: hypothetical protein MPJ24_10705 [Pirellulaceae bacterium]|nr:hypothetical protein [Pirellulaceae bacterium]